MDENIRESLEWVRGCAESLISSIEMYEETERKSILRTIRKATLDLARAGKDFRSTSINFEKALDNKTESD